MKENFYFRKKWLRSKTDVSLKVEHINIRLFSSGGEIFVKVVLFKIIPGIMAKLKFLTVTES